jgi:hypothetical protein
MVQVRNLLLEFEVPFIFHIMLIFFFFLPIKKLRLIKFGGKNLGNLHIRI